MFTLDCVAMLLERKDEPAMMLGSRVPMEWLSYPLSPQRPGCRRGAPRPQRRLALRPNTAPGQTRMCRSAPNGKDPEPAGMTAVGRYWRCKDSMHLSSANRIDERIIRCEG
jgi:hypothetical protein